MSAPGTLAIGNDNDAVLYTLREAFSGSQADLQTAFDAGDFTLKCTVCENTYGDITGATNATPIVITSAAHGLSNGDIVAVVNVGGNGAARGTFTVANKTTDTFELSGSAGSGSYTQGGKWYKSISGGNALAMANEGGLTFRATLSGLVGLVHGSIYWVVIYATGTLRDSLNYVGMAQARIRGAF